MQVMTNQRHSVTYIDHFANDMFTLRQGTGDYWLLKNGHLTLYVRMDALVQLADVLHEEAGRILEESAK